MNTETTSQSKQPSKGGRRLFKFFKVFFGILFFLVIAGVITHFMWVRSGSNEWKQVMERDEVVVHSLKAPGSFVLQLKATKRMRTKLGGLISAMQDVDAMCSEGCYEAIVVNRVDSPTSQVVYTYSLFDMPFPLTDREWVLENKFRQDPDTYEIIYKIDAVPYLVPPKDGFVRITHFDNEWRFIPVGNGEVDVEWYMDMSYGGYVANLFHNLVIPNIMPESMHEIERIVQNEKYQNAKFEFVTEVDDIKTDVEEIVMEANNF